MRSAGLAVAAVDAVFGADGDFGAKTARRALVLARPPGHHAEPDAALGFCLYNNALVGVAHAQAAHGVGRCAILDFDVHQGNGNAAMCWDDPTRLYASTHERGIFPCGVSAYAERPNPSVLNRPLSAGAGSAEFRRAWTELLEAVDRFEPEAIFLSAGFDAHADEELASINLADDDYDWITRQAVALAGDRPVVSVLEGGSGSTCSRDARGCTSRRCSTDNGVLATMKSREGAPRTALSRRTTGCSIKDVICQQEQHRMLEADMASGARCAGDERHAKAAPCMWRSTRARGVNSHLAHQRARGRRQHEPPRAPPARVAPPIP